MPSKEEIENENRKHIKEVLTEYKDYMFEFDTDNLCIADILEYINQLELEVKTVTAQRNELATNLSDKEDQKHNLIERLEERIKSVEKTYETLLTDIGGVKIINVSGLSRKEKEEVLNKRNCLIVQKAVYEEILDFIKEGKINHEEK